MLPSDCGPGLWLTATGAGLVVGADAQLAGRRLRALRDSQLVRDDCRHPPAFARTLLGDCALFRALANGRSEMRAAA